MIWHAFPSIELQVVKGCQTAAIYAEMCWWTSFLIIFCVLMIGYFSKTTLLFTMTIWPRLCSRRITPFLDHPVFFFWPQSNILDGWQERFTQTDISSIQWLPSEKPFSPPRATFLLDFRKHVEHAKIIFMEWSITMVELLITESVIDTLIYVLGGFSCLFVFWVVFLAVVLYFWLADEQPILLICFFFYKAPAHNLWSLVVLISSFVSLKLYYGPS